MTDLPTKNRPEPLSSHKPSHTHRQNLAHLLSFTMLRRSICTGQQPFSLAATIRRRTMSSSRSSSSGSANLTAAEREAARQEANEKLRAYHVNRPPLEVIYKSKKRSRKRDAEHRIQIGISECLLLSTMNVVCCWSCPLLVFVVFIVRSCSCS